jgi:hypothetical protein
LIDAHQNSHHSHNSRQILRFMKIISDQPALRRRASLAHAASLGGLLVLLGSVALSLWKPDWSTVSTVLLFAGFAVSVAGIAYANRWVKRPRPEQVLGLALKGLSDQHRLYHYTRFGDHILLTPNSVVVIESVPLEGLFTYKDGRWKQKISLSRATRFLVEEHLGDPIQRAQASAAAVQEYLGDGLPAEAQLPVQPVVVFTHPFAQVQVDSPPAPVIPPDRLLKKLPRPSSKLDPATYQHARQRLDALLPGVLTV